MLIKVKEIVDAWSIRPTGVIHIGAHAAEESNDYQQHSWGPVTWIEANPSLINHLKEIVPSEDTVICAALWDQDEISIDFNIATNGESSSLLLPARHLKEYPEIHFNSQLTVRTKRLDSVLNRIPNFLNLDVQGAELKVLHGMGTLIDSLDYIYLEVNDVELYVGCAKLNEIDLFLNFQGFKRICLRRSGRSGWGDALYVRRNLKLRPSFKISSRTFINYSKYQVYFVLSYWRNRRKNRRKIRH